MPNLKSFKPQSTNVTTVTIDKLLFSYLKIKLKVLN